MAIALENIPVDSLIAGIPVLDSDTISITAGSANTRTYIVPGSKKARASLADDQELACDGADRRHAGYRHRTPAEV